jgi:hypothetical protein
VRSAITRASTAIRSVSTPITGEGKKLDARYWLGVLTAEVAAFEAAGAVLKLCNDPDLFVFKTICDPLVARDRINNAVLHYITTGRWPTLDAEDTIYVHHRLLAARPLLEQLLRDPHFIDQLQPPAEGSDRTAVLTWLLIDVWDQVGATYMDVWARDYLRANPPPPAAGSD